VDRRCDSGPVLLCVIIACTHIDTRAASKCILCYLENLAAIMLKLNSNVELFNIYVEDKYSELLACAMQDAVVITHLFQGYEAASDEIFVTWIKHHHDSVNDGKVVYMTAQLMQMACRKHSDLISNGTWACPNADQEKLIALLTSDIRKINKVLRSLPMLLTCSVPSVPKMNGNTSGCWCSSSKDEGSQAVSLVYLSP